MRWTDSQYQAIISPAPSTLPSQTLLVAAAAGSGKTAVLVERIMHRLQNKDNPIAINELLVLTFTKAAAAEMKGRIGAKLAEVYNETHDEYLEQQLNLLPSAQISTLHSFCQWVIRNYFYELDMDPSMCVGNDGQMSLLRADVMDELFEKAYEEGKFNIINLADMFGNDRDDTPLKEVVERLFKFSQAQENPMAWLESLRMDKNGFEGNIEDHKWGQFFMDKFKIYAKEYEVAYEKVMQAASYPENEKFIGKAAKLYSTYLDKIISAENWAQMHDVICELKVIGKHPAGAQSRWSKANVYEEELIQQADAARKDCKDIIEKLQVLPQRISAEEWREQNKEQVSIMDGLVDLTLEFSKGFKDVKIKEGLLDFNDLEHNCLALLTDGYDENNKRKPSKVALELQNHFKEIMIDEYQDTNGVQEAIANLVSRKDNRFYVGDVNQSIYGFRMADPSLFIEKYNTFGHDVEVIERRIDLSQNFRSDANVLNGTNYIFSQIMTAEATELDYGEKEALYAGRMSEDVPNEFVAGPVEIIAIEKTSKNDNEDGDDLVGIEIEAKEIAYKLLELKSNKAKVQNKDGTYREMRWSDVAILLRSVTNRGNIMADILRSFGIPTYVSEKTGYFRSMEVQLLLSLLQIVDNPEQDLPMASVLRSPLVGIDANTLGEIRCFGNIQTESSTLWQVLPKFAKAHNNEKLERFVAQLERWRTISRRHSVSDLIWDIFEETGFVSYVSAMPNGIARRANVLALYQRAKDYEAGNFRGLFRFLRFIEGLQYMGEDLAGASTLGEGDDVVRIMTIHQSKGLEFPIVFVANANKKFNEMDLNKDLLLHKTGIGLKGYYPELRVSYPSLSWLYVKDKLKNALKAEEQRILYVALTRARDKLYIVGLIDKAESFLKDKLKVTVANSNITLPTSVILDCDSYFKWIWLAVARHLDGAPIRYFSELELCEHEEIPFSNSSWKINIIDANEKEMIETAKDSEDFDEIAKTKTASLTDDLINRLEYEYPYKIATKTAAKTSVTELKRRFMQQSEDEQPYKDFVKQTSVDKTETQINEKRINDDENIESKEKALPVFDINPSWLIDADVETGTHYGTIMHSIMQYLPVKEYTQKSINLAIETLVEENKIRAEDAKRINRRSLLAFFKSDLAKRVMASPEIHREWSFSILIEGNKYYKDLENGEELFLQGIMDLVFLEGDEWVLVDYKTDRVKTAGELVARYEIQLQLYKDALEQITKRKVKAVLIYSYALGEEICLELQ